MGVHQVLQVFSCLVGVEEAEGHFQEEGEVAGVHPQEEGVVVEVHPQEVVGAGEVEVHPQVVEEGEVVVHLLEGVGVRVHWEV